MNNKEFPKYREEVEIFTEEVQDRLISILEKPIESVFVPESVKTFEDFENWLESKLPKSIKSTCEGLSNSELEINYGDEDEQ